MPGSPEWWLKVLEGYKKVEDFERAYLSPKAVFGLMKKTGVISEEEQVDLNNRYDITMAPVNKKIDDAKNVIYEHTKALVMPLFSRNKDGENDD
jgi:hypothetical protein